MGSRVRSFIAVDLPSAVVRAVGKAQEGLRAKGMRLKWVRPENMHLTLKFLGDVDRERLPQIEAALRVAVEGASPFLLRVGGIGVFPNISAARVIWMGLEGAVDELAALHRRIDMGLIGLGFGSESRPFKGHLTLGRIPDRTSDRTSSHMLREALSEMGPIDSGMFTVDRIALIESDLRPTGPVYTPSAEILLTTLA